jgi:hypothetical protein
MFPFAFVSGPLAQDTIHISLDLDDQFANVLPRHIQLGQLLMQRSKTVTEFLVSGFHLSSPGLGLAACEIGREF